MDLIVEILKTPLNTILVVAGIALVVLAFFDVEKSGIKMRTGSWRAGMVPAIIGALLILTGLFFNPGGATPAQPTDVPVVLTAVSPVLPTNTSMPTDTPVPTATATDTPVPLTATATTIPVKALSDNCIDSRTWQVASTSADALTAVPNKDYCLNPSNLGIAVAGGSLRLVVHPSNQNLISGIYTDITDQSVIKFSVTVQELYAVSPSASTYVDLSIAPRDALLDKDKTGRFKLEISKRFSPEQVYFVLADPGEENGTQLKGQHPLYNRSYDVRLELHGLSMTVYINDQKQKEAIDIPGGPIVFYIGYNVPAGAAASAEVKNLKIDDVSK